MYFKHTKWLLIVHLERNFSEIKDNNDINYTIMTPLTFRKKFLKKIKDNNDINDTIKLPKSKYAHIHLKHAKSSLGFWNLPSFFYDKPWNNIVTCLHRLPLASLSHELVIKIRIELLKLIVRNPSAIRRRPSLPLN